MSGIKPDEPVTARPRHWTARNIGELSGRTAVVTGGNAGLGFETARLLAEHGALTVLACRDEHKAALAAERIRSASPNARVETVRLDLASLASIGECADRLLTLHPRLDLLINNAGVMEVPYQRTEDGFELTIGINHLGPFALTGLLLGRLLATSGSRIVTISSQGHVDGVMRFDDLRGASLRGACLHEREDGYQPDQAYFQSKLANLLFTYELDRRLQAAGATTIAVAAHPGVVGTDLFRTRPWPNRMLLSRPMRFVNFRFVQSVHKGALPTLRAATDPAVIGGEFYGPWRKSDTGYPVRVESSPRSHDVAHQARLWELSESLTGVRYAVEALPPLA